MLPRRRLAPVYTANVTVRHDELDRFGRLHPAVYLRYLAHAAVEASSAAGYDAAWYAAAGAMWLVRRTTFDVFRPVGADDRLAIRTWVEDFRRVRSHRRYAVHGADGGLRLEALTDWVYVDAATGRPRRVPAEIEAGFGIAPGQTRERDGWDGPPPPAAPARSTHRVRACEVDTVGHVNNAAYLDVMSQAVLDALEQAGWPLDRMVADGGIPFVGRADLEYRDGARYGDDLTIATWFTPGPRALDAHQEVTRAGTDRALVRATTRWHWAEPGAGARVDVPDAVLADLRPVRAA